MDLGSKHIGSLPHYVTATKACNVSHNDIKREDLFVSTAGRLVPVPYYPGPNLPLPPILAVTSRTCGSRPTVTVAVTLPGAC